MPLCPDHHLSADPDFCSVCGLEMQPSAPPSAAVVPVAPTGHTDERCAVCDTPRETSDRVFCEVCGFNFATGTAPASPAATAPPEAAPAPAAAPIRARWELVARIRADADPDAPVGAPERVFPLDLPDLLIGRRSVRRGIAPEIALESDDGISHRHARLRRRSDDRFELLDLGSANGTSCNGTPLEPNVPAPLQNGDRIQLGRWTELSLRPA